MSKRTNINAGGQLARLALRQEGDLWVGYLAPPDTMEKALTLGSVSISLVEGKPELQKQFKDLMKAVFDEAIKEALGVTPDWSQSEETPAPAHEKAGHS